MFDTVKNVNHGMLRKFPNGNEPFQIMTRLLEETEQWLREDGYL